VRDLQLRDISGNRAARRRERRNLEGSSRRKVRFSNFIEALSDWVRFYIQITCNQ